MQLDSRYAAALLLLAGCASPVPERLAPAPDTALTQVLAARGVQIYECRGSEWAFVAPEAQLFDAAGRPAGRHGAGPFWQADDGSRVVGKLQQRVDAPQAGAIPWLLLGAESTGTPGAFSRVTQIQRINTAGGVAPAGACTAGATTRVAYTADYRFFSPR